MKKTLLLTLAVGALSASQLMAVDLYITGSTAFRKQCYTACTKLFAASPPVTIVWDTSGLAGGTTATDNSNPVWTMNGNAASGVSALSGGALTIHGDFTGSVQGLSTVESRTRILFLSSTGTLITNTPTIAFSDVNSSATPFAATGNFSEDQVAVQPFVFVKAPSAIMAGVTNITWEQIKYLHSAGNTPLSVFTGNPARDYNTNVYILNRTKDSGTRRTTFAYVNAGYSEGITTYNYDVTNNQFYLATGTTITAKGSAGSGIIGGTAGYLNANLGWGPGYIGGSDIAAALTPNSNNLAVAYLSFADSQKVVSGSGNFWSQVIPLNGVWPTAAGPGVLGNQGTNDFTPVTTGQYGLWAYEIVVYPNVDPSSLGSGVTQDQNLTHAQLGSASQAGTLLGVLDNVTHPGTAPLVGSIDNEIEASKTGSPGATAIRYYDMTSSRQAVGGVITP